MSQAFQQGTFGCFGNFGICIIGFCCPCYIFGKNAEALGESCLVCGFCHMCEGINLAAAVALRGRLREKRGIEGTLTEDIMCWLCCPMCTLCQEAAEVKAMQGGMAQHMSVDMIRA